MGQKVWPMVSPTFRECGFEQGVSVCPKSIAVGKIMIIILKRGLQPNHHPLDLGNGMHPRYE